jgi:hypothetical protein
MLLGQTLDGMRVWDIHRAVAAVQELPETTGRRIHLWGEGYQAVNALYASLFASELGSLNLIAPPASHANGPDYLNVLRILDIPQTVVLPAERHPIRIHGTTREAWSWSVTAARNLGFEQLQFVD